MNLQLSITSLTGSKQTRKDTDSPHTLGSEILDQTTKPLVGVGVMERGVLEVVEGCVGRSGRLRVLVVCWA